MSKITYRQTSDSRAQLDEVDVYVDGNLAQSFCDAWYETSDGSGAIAILETLGDLGIIEVEELKEAHE